VSTSLSKPLAQLCAVLLLLLPAGALALAEDSGQPIRVESDSASRDDSKGILTYTGAVVIDQGSLHIEADKVTVHFADGKVARIVCEGEPARYRQQPQPGEPPVTANARTIDYHMADELLVLTGTARIEQQGSILEGEHVTYDITREQIRARGDETNRRIRMVIPPETEPEQP
jgi:lipopolysaccharide export system protein LptA